MILKRNTMCFKKWQPPHPEEKFNLKATEDNTSADDAIFRWYHDYNVPYRFREFWTENIRIYLDDTFVGAGTWEDENGLRHNIYHPGYLNSGCIAHERSHDSHDLLTEEEKLEFHYAYHAIKDTNKTILKLWKYNTYGTTSDIEAHAEIYRYLGEEMPEVLKQFYPKLF